MRRLLPVLLPLVASLALAGAAASAGAADVRAAAADGKAKIPAQKDKATKTAKTAKTARASTGSSAGKSALEPVGKTKRVSGTRLRLRQKAAVGAGKALPRRPLTAAEVRARAAAARRESRERRLRRAQLGLVAPAATPSAPAAPPPAIPHAAPAPASVAAAVATPAPARAAPAPAARRRWFSSDPAAAPASVNLVASAPPGFEDFLKPQQTMVDVYFGGVALGSMLAEYTPDGIEFLRPEELVERIPNALDRGALAQHLRGRLPRNSELACGTGQSADCGRLEPEVIGVIFDENRFRADVFVHPGLLAVQERQRGRYLPSPADPEAVTLVQNLAAIASGNDGAEASHTLTGNTWLARGTDHVHAQWYNTQAQSFAIDQLAWHRDRPGFSYVAGLFEARSDDLYFAQSALLAGGGAGRSLKLRTDIAGDSATRLQVFLDSRSTVEIHRDGRLVSSRFYDPGNQVLDTSALPYGSYDVEIRVVDAGGRVQAFNRFFIKTTQLAPAGEPQWYVEGGEVMRRSPDSLLPEDAGTPQLRGAWRSRLREDLGYSVAGAAVDTHALAEGAMTWLQPRFSLTGGGMLSTQGDNGLTLSASGRWGDLTGSIGLRQANAAHEAWSTSDYQLVPGSSESRSAGLNYPVARGQLSASIMSNRAQGVDSNIYSLRYSRNLIAGLFPPMFLNAQLSRADGDLVAVLGISINGFGQHWSWRLEPGLQHRVPEQGPDTDVTVLAASASWRDGERFAEDLEVIGRASIEEASESLGLGVRYFSGYGRLEAGTDFVSAEDADSRRFNVRYETSVVATSDHVGFGGQQNATGSVLLDLRTAPEDAEFDVYVDNRRLASARGGRQQPLMLGAYNSYDIRLVDRGLTLLNFDGAARTVTIYPGTVASLAYKVERAVIAFGRLMQAVPCSGADCTPALQPMANARLLGVSGLAMTEEDGRFQAELLTSVRRLTVRRSGSECVVELPEPKWVNGMMVLGDLVCTPTVVVAPVPPTPAGGAVPAVPLVPAAGTAGVAGSISEAGAGQVATPFAAGPVPATATLPATEPAATPAPVAATAAAAAPPSVEPAATAADVAPAPAAAAVPVRAARPAATPRGRKGGRATAPPAARRKAATAEARPGAGDAAAPARAKVPGAIRPAVAPKTAKQWERRRRLRESAEKVNKAHAELVMDEILKGGKLPQKKSLPEALTPRERLKQRAEKARRSQSP